MSEEKQPSRQLAIHFNNQALVGKLIFNEDYQCHLIYEKSWIKNGFPLSPNLHLNKIVDSEAVVNFLKNLFPEGESFDVLLNTYNISKKDCYSILKVIGHDLAGAFVFSSLEEREYIDCVFEISKSELNRRLDTKNVRNLVVWNDRFRLTIAGVQNKLNILKNESGAMSIVSGKVSSTHLLKFSTIESPSITINEFFCMSLAKHIGLQTADVQLFRVGLHDVLEVTRFDRSIRNEINDKTHIIDGCQVLNLPASHKYEQNLGSSRDVSHIRNGATLKALFSFANQCQNKDQTICSILDWVIFNVLIGNSDAHGKNISFYANKDGYKLAPFYDLLSVTFEATRNKGIDTGMAMSIGDNFDVDCVSAYDLLNLAHDNQISFDLLKERLNSICQSTKNALNESDLFIEKFNENVTNEMLNLKHHLIARCDLLAKQYDEIDFVVHEAF